MTAGSCRTRAFEGCLDNKEEARYAAVSQHQAGDAELCNVAAYLLTTTLAAAGYADLDSFLLGYYPELEAGEEMYRTFMVLHVKVNDVCQLQRSSIQGCVSGAAEGPSATLATITQ
jgi:hypothetical protein